MEIIINGQHAALKKNTSFEYICENRLFTGSDSYTLTITFPLKGCPENRNIFGYINRVDVAKDKVVYDCDIRDRSFFKSGIITVTEVSEIEVKTQFLEGRSEQNFDQSFDEIYINDLTLGYADIREESKISPTDAFAPYPSNNAVALPWVNNTSGNLQNSVKYSQGSYSWNCSKLTYQPYLIYIVKQICKAVGYTYNLDDWENSQYKYLLVCNTLPAAWEAWDYGIALPHWSLTEFFEQLEYFLFGEFTINHKLKNIEFHFTNDVLKDISSITIDKVIDSYTTEISTENKSNYMSTFNLKYAESVDPLWPYKSCQWYIDANKSKAVTYEYLDDLIDDMEPYKVTGVSKTRTGEIYSRGFSRGSNANKLFYAKDVDTYFILYCYKTEFYRTLSISDHERNIYKYYYRLMPVNEFGAKVVDKKADSIEINIIPAWIDDTDDEHGPCIFMECGDLDESTTWKQDTTGISGQSSNNYSRNINDHPQVRRSSDNLPGTDDDYNNGELIQSTAGREIKKGEQDKSSDFIDKIYVAYWDGNITKKGKLPHPVIDSVEMDNDSNPTLSDYSMRLNQREGTMKRNSIYNIDPKKKYSFSFLSPTIPNARALFYIRGSQYVCEKITATFKENGMSQLLKGTFYRLAD